MNYYSIVSLFNGVVILCVGFYLLSHQRQNSLYQSFAAFSASVGLWCIFYTLWQIQTSKDVALFCSRLLMLFCYFIPSTFLWFVLNLAGWRGKRWHSFALMGPSFIFALLSFTPLMIRDVEPKLEFPFWPMPGYMMHVFVLMFVCGVIFSFWTLWRAYGTAEGVRRWQIRWVGLILLPGWIGGVTNWFLWYNIPIPPISHFFVGVAFLILFFAIVRGRLFDIDAITDLVQEAKLSALGLMATSINHEVRNPLFVIKGLAETLLDKEDTNSPEMIKDIARRTIAQADRALEIIRNFSEYAKRQNSKTFDMEELDLREVLERVVPFVRSELALDNIKLTVNVPSKTAVYADQHSLEEIFLNLIVNACQAMKNSGEIEITTEEEKPWVSIKIRDTGQGLAPEQLDRIFEPFYTTKSSGTGLGLYVVSQLVGKNKGKVEVHSTLGHGTVFTVTLPANG